MAITRSLRSPVQFTGKNKPTVKPEITPEPKTKKPIGLPMQYVAEEELDKMAGSIRIKL